MDYNFDYFSSCPPLLEILLRTKYVWAWPYLLIHYHYLHFILNGAPPQQMDNFQFVEIIRLPSAYTTSKRKTEFMTHYFMITLLFLFACDSENLQEKQENHSVQHQKNHLVNETSPYLLQHADNPVDWYPWGEEALDLAKSEDKPILLSIGYAACHWCHVMEHESFEDPEIARLMNDSFICIKVDREERPDIDQIYMKFVQMTTGSGGWPLNVFLTPDQEPYYGGTYFPPDGRYGRPSWKRVLESASNFYRKDKQKLNENIDIIKKEFQKSQEEESFSDIPDQDIVGQSARQLASHYDPRFGGIGHAPKFPAVYPLSFFLRHYKNSGNRDYLDMVTNTLEKMAKGGIYDQIGGGFARYSVDERWLVPHFEKMLYDNAQLVPIYLDTYLLTGDIFFKQIAEGTLTFVMRELLSPEGGFYSSLDADSEGVEGKFYVWDKSEIDQLLGAEKSEIFCDYYDVTENGNFEHKNILNIQTDVESTAKRFNTSRDMVEKILEESRGILLEARSKRIRPGLDDKILTAWNGLMLSAFARMYQIDRKDVYKEVIENNIDFIKQNLYNDEHLLRTYNKGQAKYQAYLDDYAFLIQGLLDAYEALFNVDYLEWAYKLSEYTNSKFWDDDKFGYFYTSSDQEELIERLKDEHDASLPSGSAIMMINHLRFYSITESTDFLDITEKILKKYGKRMVSNPYGYASYLLGVDFYTQKPKEIVLVLPQDSNADKYLDTIYKTYLPNKVVLTLREGESTATLSASLLQGKDPINGEITAYVCHNFACSPPVFTTVELQKLLE